MSKKAKPTVSTSSPWSEAIPYLIGDESKGISGIFPEGQKLFESGQFTPEMQGVADLYSNSVLNRATDPRLGDFNTASHDMLGMGRNIAEGSFDSNFDPVAGVNASNVNLQSARKSQGPLDPTNSLKGLLSGNVTNPYLQQQADAMTANMTRNLNENVMPGIRSEALASGQYGGSRQGIAEGLAASRLNQDLAPALTNMFGGAFENAQNRMYGTATGLNDQAFQNATNNVNRDFLEQQVNADIGFKNNQQLMDKNQSNLGNRLQGIDVANNGLNMLSGLNGMQDNNFNQMMSALQLPQQYNQNNLNNYANLITSGAGMGGTQSQTNYKNPASGALGGAMSGAMMGSIVPGLGTGLGALLGGGMGLLGGM